MEREQSLESKRATQVEAFSSVVEQAVRPVVEQRERGTTPIYPDPKKIAETSIKMGSGKIIFEQFEPDNSSILGGINGVRNVTHAVTLSEAHQFYGNIQRAAVFCLTNEGVITRYLSFNSNTLFAPNTQREVDPEEADALISFLTSPHLNLDKLEILFRLTSAEEASLADQREGIAKADEEIAARMRENEERQRKAIEETDWETPLG